MRTSARAGSFSLTHSAITMAMAIAVGIVPSANQALLPSTCQKIGSSSSAA